MVEWARISKEVKTRLARVQVWQANFKTLNLKKQKKQERRTLPVTK